MDNTAIISAATTISSTSRCVPPPPVAGAAINLVAERFQAIVDELRREAWRIQPYDEATALRLDDAATAFNNAGTSILQDWLCYVGILPPR